MEREKKMPRASGLVTAIVGVAIITFFAGCATTDPYGNDAEKTEPTAEIGQASKSDEKTLVEVLSKPKGAAPPIKFNMQERMAPFSRKSDKGIIKKPKGTYKFHVEGMPVRQALKLFARTYGLNMITDLDVTGRVTVNVKNLSFEKAMEAILEVHGYYWEWKEGLILVHKHETKMFTIDYITLVRGGSGKSQAQISAGGVGSGGGGKAGKITINQKDEINFWDDLEEQLEKFLSKEGKVIINRLSGIIFITDFHRNVERMEHFIAALNDSIYRQVEIQVRIFEVTLNDESSMGVDWTQVINDGAGADLSTSNIISVPFGETGAKDPTTALTYGVLGGYNFNAVIQAMQEHGSVKIVSQPKIRALNNQPALIKIGTERPFFQATSTPTGGVGGAALVTVTETVEYITEGVVLSVTPQISKDGWIMLDVTPIITRLIDSMTSVYGSTAPVMDVKQSSTVVRLRDGEMVIIGGLIQDEESETERRVPLLGSIPIIGSLFKATYKTKTKRELAVFLTPRIIMEKPAT